MTSLPLDSTHGQQRRAWHDIAAFGQHTRSYVKHDMTSPPLVSTHGRTTWGVACHHRLWVAHTVERRQAWHAIIALGWKTRSNVSGVACHHRLWGAHRIERCRAFHAIIAFGQHTRSDDVGRGMTSLPLDNTHGRQHRAWHDDITALGQNTWSETSSMA